MVLTHRVLIDITINAQLLPKIPSVKSRLQEEKKFYEEVIEELQSTADAVAKNTQQLLHYWALKFILSF